MLVLVTGAAGFVGSRLSRTLIDRGDAVIGFDSFNDYYAREHKDRHLADLLSDAKFKMIEGDLRDAKLLREIFQQHKPDAVAHLAGMAAVRYSVEHPLLYADVNVQGSVNLLDAARLAGNRPTCVLASTGSVYGADTPVPFVETAAAACPLAPYPASKRAMELFAFSYAHLWKLPTTVVRFFNVYGPHGRPDMMPWILTKKILAGEPYPLYGAGNLKRDWTYVDDIVAGLIAAIDTRLANEIINLGCGSPVSNLAFVSILERLLGKKATFVDTPTPASEPLITYADVTKANKLLGYEPKVPVAEGLRRFIEWMRAEKII
jgi:UDP-glucuronate 4-epimerase